MHPRNELLLFFLLCLLARSDATSFSFDFPSFTLRNITLLGDSYLRNGVVGLTREVGVPSSSSGSVIYNNLVRFFDTESNTTASFSTRFSFSVDNVNPTSFGDGLAFFISPDNQTLGSPGGYLGLVNSSELTKNKFVAVEFDTRQDLHFSDPDGNHVGLDMESLVSIKTANARRVGINLRSGNWITAWIDYKNAEKKLEVFLSYSSFKPETPLMEVDNVDLSGFLQEFMYVGFSASTEGSTELHYIENWSFQTSLDVRPPLGMSSMPLPLSFLFLVFLLSMCSFERLRSVIMGRRKFRRLTDPTDNEASNAQSKRRFNILRLFGFFSPRLLKSFWRKPKEYRYSDLCKATENFNEDNIIGQGGFGNVFKGSLNSGTVVAIKKSKNPTKSTEQLGPEKTIVSELNHKNILRLLGWCEHEGELLLVYPCMPKGSLDRVLAGEGEPLTWEIRYNITMGIASALAYLQEDCKPQVIHMDIKPSNIMLDSDYNPMLGDFGSARTMNRGGTPIPAAPETISFGYSAPEYPNAGGSDTTDVYSFGVISLQLATGRAREDLAKNLWNDYHAQSRLLEAADQRLNGVYNPKELEKVLILGLSCANPSPADRPSMKTVLQILKNKNAKPPNIPASMPIPGPPAPTIKEEDIESGYGSNRSEITPIT